MADRKQGLGKGLAALISSNEIDNSNSAYVEKFNINDIKPNPYQPRMHIDNKKLIDLADSIRIHGVIQPLLVTKDKDGDGYFLIAGERRWRAAKLAGLKSIPVVIKESSPLEMLELALIENIQRQDLNPLEEANSFAQLQEIFGLTHGAIAKKLGMSRVFVSNKIRLLKLPEKIKSYVLSEQLTEGHARALMGIEEENSLIAAAEVVIRRGMSVREVEELVRKITYSKVGGPKVVRRTFDQRAKDYSIKLTDTLGHNTTVQKLSKGGKVVIKFTTVGELDEIMDKLVKGVGMLTREEKKSKN